jgi:hypothetical protein
MPRSLVFLVQEKQHFILWIQYNVQNVIGADNISFLNICAYRLEQFCKITFNDIHQTYSCRSRMNGAWVATTDFNYRIVWKSLTFKKWCLGGGESGRQSYFTEEMQAGKKQTCPNSLWWTNWLWGRFSPSTSVSPANLHSTDCSTITIIYHLGLVQ